MEWFGIIISIIVGTVGTVLGILNCLRDKPNVKILLQWDMLPYGDSRLDKGALYGVVKITNAGRRCIYVSHVSIYIPNTTEELLLLDTIEGVKLCEGDPPKIYYLKQKGLEKYQHFWNKMYVVIRDCTGKEYKSKAANKMPSWAE